MKFRYMMIGDNVRSITMELNMEGHGDTYPPQLVFGEEELVVAVDPGTTGVGMTIGLLNKPTAICILQINRGTSLLEDNADVFTNSFNKFLDEFFYKNNVKEMQIESQFLNPKWKESYRAVTSFTDSVKGTAAANSVKTYTVAPQTWKGIFLEKYPQRSSLNMTKSNKEHIISWTRQICPTLYAFNATDAMDSFGILFYYYRTNFRPKGKNHVIQVRKDMPRDYRSQVTMMFGALTREKTVDKILQTAENFSKTSTVERGIQMFKVSEDFSLEDNIRSLITDNNEIYVAFFEPYTNMVAELFKNRDKIGTVELNTPMYLLGYRTNGKK